jgi:pimeloyl-ACP methyl ester carboxylesterase
MKSVERAAAVPFYRQQGDGSVAIALHGSASTGAQWMSLMDRLEHAHRVLAPDLPGYGASVDVAGGTRSPLRASARAIAEIIVSQGEAVHLIGHSYGGTVALKMALVWPELVRSLTLIEPAAFHFLEQGGHGDAALFAEIRAVEGVMAAGAASDAPDAAMAHFVDYWNGAGTWLRLGAEQRARLTPQLGAVLSNFAAGFADTTRLDACAALTCPVQLVMGLQSKAPAQRVTELVAEAVPQARLSLIGDAGHMAPVTHPGVVSAIVERHLAQAEGRAEAKVRRASLPRWVA